MSDYFSLISSMEPLYCILSISRQFSFENKYEETCKKKKPSNIEFTLEGSRRDFEECFVGREFYRPVQIHKLF